MTIQAHKTSYVMRKHIVLLLLLGSTTIVLASSDPRELFRHGEVGFDGYDLVSYFSSLEKGNGQFKTTFRGVKLHFASQENLEKFLSYPDRYWPAFDGWCAISLVYDVLKKPDFSHYKIQNNKIYFFEIRAFFNGLTQWEKDPTKNDIVARVHYRHYLDGI